MIHPLQEFRSACVNKSLDDIKRYDITPLIDNCHQVFLDVCSTGKLDIAKYIITFNDFNNGVLLLAFDHACKNNENEICKWLAEESNQYVLPFYLHSAERNNNEKISEMLISICIS